MLIAETVSFWLAVVCYALSFVLYIVSILFKKKQLASTAALCVSLGFSVHTASLGIRWIINGYPPFVHFFESVSASCWFAVFGFLLLNAFKKGYELAGAGLMATVFLLLGWASTPSYSGEALSASLQSVWLFIHASFATAGCGAFLVAAALGGMWLRKRRIQKPEDTPSPASIDETIFRFVSIGFFFYSIMIISGAIWANQAWGRYWGWDPIETWSLVTWLVYVVYLHIRFTYPRARGVFTAWYVILAALFAVFSLWGVGYVYQTIHTYG
jgi:cytochrome c-type biogenesis protein CcsB